MVVKMLAALSSPRKCFMRGRSRVFFLALVALLTLSLLGACSGYKTFAVVAFIPTDEGAQALAQSVKRGIEFSLSELNSREGIHGRAINIRFYACAAEHEAAEKMFARAIREFSPVLIFAVDELARILAPQAEKKSIPLIGLSIADEDFTEGRQWVFRNAVTHGEENRALLDTAAILGLRQMSVIHNGSDEARAFITLLEKKSEQENIRLRITQQVYSEEGGIGAAIAAQLGAEALLFLDTSDILSDGLEHCKTLGYRGKILSRNALFSKSLHGQFPAMSAYSSALVIYKRNFGSGKRVFDIFQVQYGEEMCIDAAFAYDTLILLSRVLPPGRINRSIVRDALDAEFVYPSSFGIRFSLAGNHDFIPKLYPVLLSPDGTVEYLEEKLPGDVVF